MTTRHDRLALLERVIAEKNDHRGVGGQARLAREMGISDSQISQIRAGVYNKGNIDDFLQLLAEKYGSETVICPLLGEITIGKCAEKRNRPFAATNPTRVALSRACKVCERPSGS